MLRFIILILVLSGSIKGYGQSTFKGLCKIINAYTDTIVVWDTIECTAWDTVNWKRTCSYTQFEGESFLMALAELKKASEHVVINKWERPIKFVLWQGWMFRLNEFYSRAMARKYQLAYLRMQSGMYNTHLGKNNKKNVKNLSHQVNESTTENWIVHYLHVSELSDWKLLNVEIENLRQCLPWQWQKRLKKKHCKTCVESLFKNENKEFLETNYPRSRAIEVFRSFHFDLKVKNQNSFITPHPKLSTTI